MGNTITSVVELANIAGVTLNRLVPTADVIQNITNSIAERNLRIEGEAFNRFVFLVNAFLKSTTEAQKEVLTILNESYRRGTEDSIAYLGKLFVQIDKLNTSDERKQDLRKQIIDKRAEIEKLQIKEKSDITKLIIGVTGGALIVGVALLGYHYARPKTFGDFLNKLL